MASKQKNPNIGMINCQCCGATSALRKNKAGKFYYDCLQCGRITPNLPAGQKRILDVALIWGEQGTPPDNCPDWIAHNWPWHKAIKEGQGQAPAAAPQTVPVITGEQPKPAPVKRERPRMPPPPPAPVKQEPPAPAPVKQKPAGFSFLGDL